MNPPAAWSGSSRDEADRLLRRLTDVIRTSFMELELGQEQAGRTFDWTTPEAQEWILGRIRSRLFPREPATGSLGTVATPKP
jgi:hypothetical protein